MVTPIPLASITGEIWLIDCSDPFLRVRSHLALRSKLGKKFVQKPVLELAQVPDLFETVKTV